MKNDIYAAPMGEIKQNEVTGKKPSELSKALVWIGIALQALLFVGLYMFIAGMVQTFQTLQLYGTGDPQLMAGGISQALVPLLLCLIPVTVGFLMSLITLMNSNYRSKKVFKVEMLFSFFYLLYIPVGTAIGIVFMVYLFKKRKEFVD